ncbi:hypothetical protein FEM33_03830 [Dyadobacter flavalbus]|uniref:Lipoprotein n=1 Tax=Dyadobacter flavalbus TaxID=2579942 RepID=A0A5M8R0D3_9BACT|nr:hypothetical protein [Dyadobacter flavalbus]KAA6441098.1 hypothetical protein FEM33_03830 [Dyadobacter flavalbus]
MLKHYAFLLLVLSFAPISCSGPPKPEQLKEPGYNPLEAGNFSEFNVEKTTYVSGQPDKITKHVIRQLTQTPFTNPEGNPVFPQQYATLTTDQSWQTDSVAVSWHSANKVFVQENGRTVVKMILPVAEGLQWNGNEYNASGKCMFEETAVKKPFQTGSLFFPNTVTVIRQNDSTLLSRSKYTETYAAGVGLICREQIYLRYCYDGDCLGKGIVSSGWKKITKISKYGKQ